MLHSNPPLAFEAMLGSLFVVTFSRNDLNTSALEASHSEFERAVF